METKEEKSISVLNDLVIINNDRVEGYERAAKETEDSELKDVFNSMANESRKHKAELLSEVVELDGEPKEGTSTSGKFYRVWMDVKAALAGKDRKAILASCEFGEDAALGAYRDALKSDELSSDCRTIISKQEADLKKSHDKIKAMRDRA
jgi:uncharacterized protein (TIGR02284 family)